MLSRLNLWGARPDLMLLVVLAWAVVRGVDEGLMWGFIGGLIVDLLSGGPLGATALALLAVALAGRPWGRGAVTVPVLGPPVISFLLLTFLGVVVYHLVLLFVLAWTGHAVDWRFALTQVVGPSALLNVALAPFVRQPLAWLERRTRREGFAL